MLTGKHEHQIDSKNRMRLPARFKGDLAGVVFAMFSAGGCINVYSEKAFNDKIYPIFANVNEFDVKGQQVYTKVMENTFELEVDAQGRYLMPQKLLKKAKISKDLVIIGKLDKAEVWSKEVYNERFDEDEGYTEEDLQYLLGK